MLVDRESALSTDNVMDLLRNYGVTVAIFPPGLGKLMNPCDAFFHSVVKREYYKLVHQNVDTAEERKYLFMKKSYFSVREETIVSYFTRCGIVGDTSPEEIVENLLSEGLHPNPKFTQFHIEQLEAYEGWCLINGKDPKNI